MRAPSVRPALACAAVALAALTACAGGAPASLPAAAPPPSGLLTRFSIDQARHPDAVCADGSTPVFYLRRGAQADRWVVWLASGGNCYDADQCARAPLHLKSSKPWTKLPTLDARGHRGDEDGGASGILSTDPAVNPDFHDWNHAYLVYCTQDNWSGSRGASPETWGMHFRGHDVLTAMLDALSDPAVVGEPTLDRATDLLLTGSSAGGHGVRTHIDRIAPRFPNARVRGFADAGVTPAFTAVRASGDEQVWKQRAAAWQPVVDETCARRYTGDEAWKCLEGRYLVGEGLIETPTFIHMDQRDPKVVGHDRADPERRQKSMEAAAEIRAILARADGAFAPMNHLHTILDKPAFGRATCDGHTAAEVFGNWYFDRPGPKKVIADPEGAGRGAGRRR